MHSGFDLETHADRPPIADTDDGDADGTGQAAPDHQPGDGAAHHAAAIACRLAGGVSCRDARWLPVSRATGDLHS